MIVPTVIDAIPEANATIPPKMSLLPYRPAKDLRILTPKEVIGYLKEQAYELGEYGSTNNFPDPRNTFRPVLSNSNSFEVPGLIDSADEGVLLPTDQELIASIEQQDRMRALGHPKNRSAIAAAEAEIDADLAEMGKSHRFISSMKGKPRQKLVALLNLRDPPPPKNYVEVLVYVPGLGIPRDTFSAVLPMKGDLDDLSLLEDRLTTVLAGSLCGAQAKLIPGTDEIWKYQLLPQYAKKIISDASKKLETDGDYRKMVEETTRGKDAPRAVLTKVYTLAVLPYHTLTLCSPAGPSHPLNSPRNLMQGSTFLTICLKQIVKMHRRRL